MAFTFTNAVFFGHSERCVEVADETLLYALRAMEEINADIMTGNKLTVRDLFANYETWSKKPPHKVAAVNDFLAAVSAAYREEISAIEARAAAGEVCIDDLWWHFQPGTLVDMHGGSFDYAAKVERVGYNDNEEIFWLVSVVVEAGVSGVERSERGNRIKFFRGTRKLSDVATTAGDYVVKLTPEKQEVYAAIGEKVVALVTGVHVFRYDAPYGMSNGAGGLNWRPHVGRVVYHAGSLSATRSKASSIPQSELAERATLAIVIPTLSAYSFTLNYFVVVLVQHLAPPAYNHDVFALLDLEPDTRDALCAVAGAGLDNIRLLLRSADRLIVLLAGPPGAGKTLAVRALAEHYGRPLLTLSAGALGDDANAIEKALTRYTSYAANWGAVLHIDDADLVMARRAPGELSRNRAVSVFLHVIDNAQCLVLLTANTTAHIDAAMLSRIAVVLTIPVPTHERMCAIVRAIASLNNVAFSDDAVAALAGGVTSGRQVEHAVALAIHLAKFKGASVDDSHLLKAKMLVTARPVFE
jgi:hypothetical protein